MNFLKKTSAILVTVMFLSLSISPALAAGPSSPTGPRGPVGPQGQVGPTGPVGPSDPAGPNGSSDPAQVGSAQNAQANGSSETTTVGIESEKTVILDNNASIDNPTNVDIVTGGNNFSANTAMSDFSSGNASAGITEINTANSIFADQSTISSTSQEAGIGDIIFGTSTNKIALCGNANYLATGDSIAEIDNNAKVDNPINININTGDNLFSENTKLGNIVTGDINLGVNLINLLNLYSPNLLLTLDLLWVFGNLTGDIVLQEPTTTPDLNDPQIHTTDLEINQNADVENALNIKTNTGENEIGNMTAMGNVQTGSSNVKANVSNILNAIALPYFYILNIFGDWDGNMLGLDPSLVLINRISGPKSQNINSIDLSESSDLSITNEAQVSNAISIDANTGRNTLKNNTVAGNLRTGSINIVTNIVNVINSLGKGAGKLRIGIINIFGNWKGNLKSKDYNPGIISDDENIPDSDPMAQPVIDPSNENLPIFMTSDSSGNGLARKIAYKSTIANSKPENQVLSSGSNPILAKADPSSKSSWALKFILGLVAIAAAWLAFEMILKYKNISSKK